MNFQELCEKIGLPEKVRENLKEEEIDEALYRRVCDPEDWERVVKDLQAALGEDKNGYRMLSVMLTLALRAREKYRERGIPESIFLDTMAFAARFVKAHKEAHGDYAFTWGWWFVRQLSLREFRLGSLEYELTEEGISIHIPSDARLDEGAVRESLARCQSFLREFFPDYADAEFFCDSWMLSPVLKGLLPQSSNILFFQSLFERDSSLESRALLEWVYPGFCGEDKDLPENTSLQRSLKAYLLSGGKLDWTKGHIKREYLSSK